MEISIIQQCAMQLDPGRTTALVVLEIVPALDAEEEASAHRGARPFEYSLVGLEERAPDRRAGTAIATA